MARMRAGAFRCNGETVLDEVEKPRPGVGEALPRIALTTICGTGLHVLRGEYPVRPGLVIGHERVEIVEELVPGVSEIAWTAC